MAHRGTVRLGRFWTVSFLVAAVLVVSAVAQADEPDSLKALKAAVKASPKDGMAWMRLGYAFFSAGALKKAEDAFQRAIRIAKPPQAYHGLALSYRKRCREEAVSRLFCLRVKPNLEKAIARDSTYAPAYLTLAEWYADSGYEDRMVPLYERYIALRSDDLDGRYGLAKTYTDVYRYDQVLAVTEPVLADHPDEPRFLPMAAQAYAARGDAERALALFGRYFELISAAERAFYEDLSLVAHPEELRVYRATPEAERRTFLDAFWKKRDLTLVSDGKGREAEHYRRVWYARTYFAKKKQPWDRRGEVYIRYGEPDYRSRSDRVNAAPNATVYMVKERIAAWLRGDPDIGTGVGPIFPVGTWQGGADVGWESWVYTRFGDGFELVFTDEIGNGRWNFAPMPKMEMRNPELLSVNRLSRASAFLPAIVMQDVASKTPEFHDLPPGVDLLEFYYDVATFRGEGEETRVEIYFGIPPKQMAVKETGGWGLIEMDRTLALARPGGEPISRKQEALTFAVPSGSGSEPGGFIPDLVSLDVPPGDYRLAVRLADRGSGKWGLYLQDLAVPAYRDSLAMSDLEMAWVISDREGAEKFRKGEVWVVPMPSRSYRGGQNAYVYYEVYNLQRDAFGQTRYQVAYAIRHHVQKKMTLVGLVARGFDSLFSRKKPQVAVQYERAGTEASEPVYFELDTRQLKPGLNQIEVRVTDLNGGETVSRKAMFQLDRETQSADTGPQNP